jgi:hypothetical protein
VCFSVTLIPSAVAGTSKLRAPFHCAHGKVHAALFWFEGTSA